MRIVILLGILVQIILNKRNRIIGAAVGFVITALLLIWGLVAYSQGNTMVFFSAKLSEPLFVLLCLGWFAYDAYLYNRAVKAAKKAAEQEIGSNPPVHYDPPPEYVPPPPLLPTSDAEGNERTAHFSSRSGEEIECPVCRKKQMSNRNGCFSCGCKFIYDDETATTPVE